MRSIKNLDKVLAILLVLLFIATATSSVFLTRTLISARHLINSGSNVVTGALNLQNLEIAVQTANSAQKSYLLTGDTAYLKQVDRALKPVPALKKDLANPAYEINRQKLKQLNDLVDQRISFLKHNIELYQSGQKDAAIAAVSSEQGLKMTNKLLTLSENIRSETVNPYGPLVASSQHNITRSFAISISLVVVVLALSLLILWYFNRALRQERENEVVKNEFLSLASHQLRTPATNVKQYLSLLLEGHLGKLTARQKEALTIAERNNETGISIINGLLDIAKVDLDQIQLRKEPVNIYSLAKGVADSYQPVARERRQTIRFRNPDKQAETLADPIYLKGVVENLIDNASKYSKPRTRITMDITSQPRTVRLAVTDQGVGIARQDTRKLFKKFSRIPNELSPSVDATGLGLYWVKRIVSLHRGRVMVKSAPGRGSTFTIELPNAHPEED